MLSFSFQFPFHKPITCLHKLSYWPFLNSPTETNAHIRIHNNNLSVVFMSQPKHCVLSIGSPGFHPKDLVPSVVLCEEEDDGSADDDYDDEEYVERRENFDAYVVSKKELRTWGEVEDNVYDIDDDNDIQGKEEFDTSFMEYKELLPWGEVEDDGEDDDNDIEGRYVDASFVPKKELPPCGEVEDDEDGGNDVEGRDVYSSFVAKKELPPWGEVEEGRQWDSQPAVTNLSASKKLGFTHERGALLLEEMDENVLSNRILVLSRTNKIRSAMEYFTSMELCGLGPNIHACNSLMSSLMRNGWFDDCLKVFNYTRTRKIATGHTYSLVLMAHVKVWGCDSALKFFRELENECDVEKDFDAVVYNTMISICRKVDNWGEIEGVWRSMKANGCAATHVTYCLLVNSFARCGQSELALCAYHAMVENGFEPGSNTLNVIISVCAKEGKWDAALSVFRKMLTGRLKPNLVSCNALINSVGRAGELKLAFQVYDIMKSLGHKPDIYTFNALLSSLNKANRHHEALQLFEMIERNQTSQFNIHLYNTVLMSCSKLGLWDRAIEILWQMEAFGPSDLTVSYNLVIRTCELARKPRIALQVYEHMVHQKCSPNIFTYLCIIRCCAHGDYWEELEEILNQTLPNATLYNAAVQGMCLHGKVNLANKVYTKMLECGLQPDVKTRVLMLSMMRK